MMLPASAMPVNVGNFYSDFFPAPTHAYSLYKLNKNYNGVCVRISRWDGSSMVNAANIGFDATGFVDVEAISAWQALYGGAAPYVTTFYDQYGTNNLTGNTGNTGVPNISPLNTVNGKQGIYFDGVNDVFSFTSAFAMPSTFDWFISSENTNKTAGLGYGIIIANRTLTSGSAYGVFCSNNSGGQSLLAGIGSYQQAVDDYKDYAIYNFTDVSSANKSIRRDGAVLSSTNLAVTSSGTITGVGRYRNTGTAYSSALTQGFVLYNNGDASAYRDQINTFLMNLMGV